MGLCIFDFYLQIFAYWCSFINVYFFVLYTILAVIYKYLASWFVCTFLSSGYIKEKNEIMKV